MFDHYIALDWAQRNMAIARMTKSSNRVSSVDVPADIKELRVYFSRLKGTKILTFEETTTAQWLFTELKPYVSEIVVCDPYRNRLLSEGPKTDRIDAEKLVRLLRSDMLKPVFHCSDDFIHLRKLASGYQDVVKAGVRLKNQRSALFRAVGKDKSDRELTHKIERFVLEGIDRGIEAYEEQKKRYEAEFHLAWREHPMIRNLESIPGIGEIGAVKTAAIVVKAERFETDGKWLVYCGLLKLERMSGGRSYGRKTPRYCRTLKSVFKTAALAVINSKAENVFKDYYNYLIQSKHLADFNARHAVARKIATVAFGVMRSGKKFEPGRLRVVAPK
jgi:transposase